MSAPSGPGPFDPGPEGRATHLVLANDRGQLSLWPVWRQVAGGVVRTVRACSAPGVRRGAGIGRETGLRAAGRPYGVGAAGPSSSTRPSASSVRQHR